jgi:hypothetical protein
VSDSNAAEVVDIIKARAELDSALRRNSLAMRERRQRDVLAKRLALKREKLGETGNGGADSMPTATKGRVNRRASVELALQIAHAGDSSEDEQGGIDCSSHTIEGAVKSRHEKASRRRRESLDLRQKKAAALLRQGMRAEMELQEGIDGQRAKANAALEARLLARHICSSDSSEASQSAASSPMSASDCDVEDDEADGVVGAVVHGVDASEHRHEALLSFVEFEEDVASSEASAEEPVVSTAVDDALQGVCKRSENEVASSPLATRRRLSSGVQPVRMVRRVTPAQRRGDKSMGIGNQFQVRAPLASGEEAAASNASVAAVGVDTRVPNPDRALAPRRRLSSLGISDDSQSEAASSAAE